MALVAAPGAVLAKPVPAPALFTAADVERLSPLDHGCILGDAAKTATPDQKIANCDDVIASLKKLKLNTRGAAQRAGIDFMIASFDFARAGAYLKVDTVRSARVCSTAERVFAQMVGIDARLFDADMTESLTTSRAAVNRSVVVCRKDFGTPAGAPALLPDQAG